MKATRELARLEPRLARDRTAILSASDVEMLDRELRRALAEDIPAPIERCRANRELAARAGLVDAERLGRSATRSPVRQHEKRRDAQ